MNPTRSHSLKEDGFELLAGVFAEDEIGVFRDEADRISEREGATCVRHLREKSELFDRLSRSSRLRQLVGTGFAPVRSILFDKTPTENWLVPWHQDLTIAVRDRLEVVGYGPWSEKHGVVHVQPPAELLAGMLTVRIHLDEARATNGALKVVPGSHRAGRIATSEVSDNIGDSVCVCECRAGDVLLMSPLILHSSGRSEKPSRRRVVHIEFARCELLDDSLEWYES